ncbi:TPA: hypothetical protein G8N95_003319 [Salmonella enterica]|uniref:Uncharacterized protein n=1 Tax=Salmonella enterica TaxID=28901 RepID=A0A750EBR4_SALER|nr:hypothetical protein [Salmonella enterica]ECD4288453.1 hypothetical protein [Salmonella enterica subsp. enterica serovar Potsdam]EDT8809135.1 hypothetical protein [Salmonella enterica subsp. enterica]EEB8306973.1 hypothetical protein [Salmonella enterica subsp. enterica serovar Oslo]MLT90386.1 hypothetical protein [Salmonella enterica subsp. enterica serovar Muenchen]
MNPTDFIRKHITSSLMAEGFPEQAALGGGLVGVDHYRPMPQASRRGRTYDDCLHYVRQWAKGQTTSVERKAKKKPGREVAPPGLF